VAWTIESVQEHPVEPAAVWALYADPATWSRWGHNATWAEAEGPMEVDGIVRVRAGYGTVYRCRIRRFEPGRALELVVCPAGLTIINVYEVEAVGAGSRIRHAFEVSGPLAALTRPVLGGLYRRQLEAEVRSVAAIAADPGAAVPPRRTGASGPERAWHRVGRAIRGQDEQSS
jgi:polyketide cyclase/dehydrase/lipid transport protein